jgi:hypothetical protein
MDNNKLQYLFRFDTKTKFKDEDKLLSINYEFSKLNYCFYKQLLINLTGFIKFKNISSCFSFYNKIKFDIKKNNKILDYIILSLGKILIDKQLIDKCGDSVLTDNTIGLFVNLNKYDKFLDFKKYLETKTIDDLYIPMLLILCSIFDVFIKNENILDEKDKSSITLDIYIHNFNSNENNNCTLTNYHSADYPQLNCSMIGFFDAHDIQFDRFYSDNKNIIIIKQKKDTEYGNISNESDYINYNVKKNEPYKLDKI